MTLGTFRYLYFVPFFAICIKSDAVFCDLFVSRDDPLIENLHADRTTVCFEP